MKKPVVSLLLAGAVVMAAAPGTAVAAPTCLPGQAPGVAPLYCIPAPASASASTAAHGASKQLSKLTHGQLLSKGHVSLPVSFPSAGTFTFTITAKLGGHTVVIGRATTTSASGATAAVKIVLSKAGRTALKQHKAKLGLSVVAVFKPADGGAVTKATSKTTLK